MTVSDKEKIMNMAAAIDEMALLGYRLDLLLQGFRYYNNIKSTLDLTKYEQAADMFVKGIAAMEEVMMSYHEFFNDVKNNLD